MNKRKEILDFTKPHDLVVICLFWQEGRALKQIQKYIKLHWNIKSFFNYEYNGALISAKTIIREASIFFIIIDSHQWSFFIPFLFVLL